MRNGRRKEESKGQARLARKRLRVCASVLPACFEGFKLLDEEGLQHLSALIEGRVAGVVVSTVIEDPGHVCYVLGQLTVVTLQQTLLHRREV